MRATKLINISGFLLEKITRFLITILIAKYYSPEVLGEYSLGFSIFMLVTVVAGFSAPNILIRFFTNKEGQERNANLITALLFYTLLLAALVFSLMLLVYVYSEMPYFSGNVAFYSIIFFACMIFYNGINLFGAYYRIRDELIIDAVLRYYVPSLFLLMSLFLILYHELEVKYFVLSWLVCYGALFIGMTATNLLNPESQFYFKKIGPSSSFICLSKVYIKYGLYILGIAVAALVVGEVDRLMLGGVLDAYEVGLFSMALLISTSPNLIIGGINFLLPPVVRRHSDNLEWLRQSFMIYVELLMVVISLFSILLLYFGENLLAWVGEDYVNSEVSKYVFIILIASIISAFTGPSGIYMQYLGSEKLDFTISIIAGLVSIFLSFFLVTWYGLIGAAFSFIISNSIVKVTRCIYLKSIQRIKFSTISLALMVLQVVSMVLAASQSEQAFDILRMIFSAIIFILCMSVLVKHRVLIVSLIKN